MTDFNDFAREVADAGIRNVILKIEAALDSGDDPMKVLRRIKRCVAQMKAHLEWRDAHLSSEPTADFPEFPSLANVFAWLERHQ